LVEAVRLIMKMRIAKNKMVVFYIPGATTTQTQRVLSYSRKAFLF